MAKVKGPISGLSGALGDVVYVRRNGKEYVRRRVRPGSKRNEPALKAHYTRARHLNKLASGINSILEQQSDRNKHGNFYFQLLKRFRKQLSDNRYVLLSALREMDIHPIYTFASIGGDQQMNFTKGNKNFNVKLAIKIHAETDDKVNCYCYQVLLLTWNKTDEPPTYSRKYSEWIYPQKSGSVLRLSFKRKSDTVHWMLLLMKQMGHDDEPVSVKQQGMRIMEVGTFNKKDEALLKKIAAEEKKRIAASVKKEEEIVRVKAKKK